MNRFLSFLAVLLLSGIVLIPPASAQISVQSYLGESQSAPIDISTATTTLIVTGVANKTIYVSNANIIAAGTGSIQFKAGTGATCGTGTVNLSGNYSLTTQVGFVLSGWQAVWTLPPGFNLCATTSANVGMAGSVAFVVR